MNVPSSSRSRSGDAWASCSSSRRAGSILDLTVIVVSFFESVFADHSKDHPVAVAYFSSDTLTGIRTPLCRTSLTELILGQQICVARHLRPDHPAVTEARELSVRRAAGVALGIRVGQLDQQVVARLRVDHRGEIGRQVL